MKTVSSPERNGPLAGALADDRTPPVIKNLARFMQLFVGGDQAHGVYRPETKSCTTPHTAATRADYEAHLAGKVGLGLVPVRTDGTCRFGAIDIDAKKKGATPIDHQVLQRRVAARRMPLTVCKSKSEVGAHLYLFVKEPGIKAAQVSALLKKWAGLLGYPKAEIFPKQAEIEAGKQGNWINLPYYSGANGTSTRYAVGERGALTLTEFLAAVEFYDPATCDADETAPAPTPAEPPVPEVPIGADGKITPGGRNVSLTKAAGAMRRHGLAQDAIEAALLAHNRTRCEPPLPEREVAAIAASAGRYEPAAERRNLTDVGNAERFIAQHGEDVRYDHQRKRWFIWNKSY